MRRFFEMLNTPMAVLSALFVVVAVNGFLFFGYHSPKTVTPSPSSLSSSPPLEHTHSPTKLEATTSSHAEETTPSRTKAPPSTTATTTATATATATP